MCSCRSWTYAVVACLSLLAASNCTRRGTDRRLISAYNVPLGEPQAIEPAKTIPGTQVWEGEVLSVALDNDDPDSEGSHASPPNQFGADRFTVKALHPFNPKFFSLWVGSSRVDFCGVNRELENVDVGELTYHSVRLTTSAGQLNFKGYRRAPVYFQLVSLTRRCYLLEDFEDLSERKEFAGFIAPSSDTVLRIVRNMDHLYGGKYKGGRWTASRTDTLESGKYRVFYALPGDDQYRFVWNANLRTGEFVPMTRCAEEVEQFMHEH